MASSKLTLEELLISVIFATDMIFPFFISSIGEEGENYTQIPRLIYFANIFTLER